MADRINLTIVLRPPAAAAAVGEQLLAGTYKPGELTPSDLSADSTEIEAVTDFATSHNLQVTSIEAAARTVRVSGSVTDIEKAFGIPSESSGEGSVQSLNYKGAVTLPAPLNQIVIAVLGLNQTPIAKPHKSGQ